MSGAAEYLVSVAIDYFRAAEARYRAQLDPFEAGYAAVGYAMRVLVSPTHYDAATVAAVFRVVEAARAELEADHVVELRPSSAQVRRAGARRGAGSVSAEAPAVVAAEAVRKYRAAIARHGLAGADDWLLGFLHAAGRRPDAVLAAVARAVLAARAERRPPGRGVR